MSSEFFRAALMMERNFSLWLESVAKPEKDLGVQNMLMNFLEDGLQRTYLVRARSVGYGPEAPGGDDYDQ